MKKLSIIIVNYNVRFFLEQCLKSVFDALEGINGEVFVVDNNSVDGSVEMIKEKFPQVRLIENSVNVGFSKANNQAIRISSGEYVLLLNPDTLVQKDTFIKCLNFMDSHPDAGGLGVQMIDGKGNFLPESKRGLPTPAVAFSKIFGLSKLFPKSKKFGKYHLTYLDKNQNHTVDVLSGAFMMIRASVLEKIGLLDEVFFMYGEDIDLSYRITQAGYKNYYFADTKIIHYKGESTKKGSLNYVITFYNAMRIFAEKHYSGKQSKLFFLLINLAIVFRASLAIMHRFFKNVFIVILDFTFTTIGYFALAHLWQKYVVFPEGGSYPEILVYIALPVYVLIWMFTSYLSGLYDKNVNLEKILKGVISGTIVILLIYSLLDVSLRFSRALILIGALWVLISFTLIRIITKRFVFEKNKTEKKRFIIVGDEEESERVRDIITSSLNSPPDFIGFVSTANTKPGHEKCLGTLPQIEEIIRIYGIHEVIFCSKNMTTAEIIDKMSQLKQTGIDMKIAPADSVFIIGSNSINSKGDIYVMNLNNIDKPENRRNKRTFDVIISIVFLIVYPLALWFIKKPWQWFLNIWLVLLGKRTWVGYATSGVHKKLPHLRKGILNPLDQFNDNIYPNDETIHNVNILYARDYNMAKDLLILLKGFRHLGRKVQ